MLLTMIVCSCDPVVSSLQSRSPAIRYSTNTQQPRNQSPVDQIVTLPSDDNVDGMRAVRGTDSPGSSASGSSSSSSGSSGYSVRWVLMHLTTSLMSLFGYKYFNVFVQGLCTRYLNDCASDKLFQCFVRVLGLSFFLIIWRQLHLLNDFLARFWSNHVTYSGCLALTL